MVFVLLCRLLVRVGCEGYTGVVRGAVGRRRGKGTRSCDESGTDTKRRNEKRE